MKKLEWSILLVAKEGTGRILKVPCGRGIIITALIFIFLGTLGIGRCVYFVSAYGFAKLSMYYQLKENQQLKFKVQFLSKIAKEQSGRIDKCMLFEDKTRLAFGMDPISSDIRNVGVGGRPDLSESAFSSFADPILMKTDTVKENIQTLLRQVKLEDTTFSSMTSVVDKQIDVWAQRPATMPVWGRITSVFGYRIHPFTGLNVFHEGIDISNPIGTPIHATADGVTAFVGYKDYFGNVIMISHPASGFKTIFAHLLRAAVSEGQAVKRGDLIGYIGSTGRSTGPHLHYEVHKLGAMVNPVDFVLPTDTMVD